MTVLLISSQEDPASTNIKQSLLEQTTWKESQQALQDIVDPEASWREAPQVPVSEPLKPAETLTPTGTWQVSRVELGWWQIGSSLAETVQQRLIEAATT